MKPKLLFAGFLVCTGAVASCDSPVANVACTDEARSTLQVSVRKPDGSGAAVPAAGQPSSRSDQVIDVRASRAVATNSFEALWSALERAERRLSQYLGPVARVVVKRAAAKARDESELYLLLADEIENPAERKAFSRRGISTSGKA